MSYWPQVEGAPFFLRPAVQEDHNSLGAIPDQTKR